MSTSIAVIVGNPKPASRTLTVASAVADEIGAVLDQPTSVTVVDLGEFSGDLLDWGSTTVSGLVDTVIAADLLVVASPVYKATYTGLLKVFLDRIAAGALFGTIAVPVMVGGAPAHALAVEVHLRPLLVELGATCTSPGLFVLESRLDDVGDDIATWLAATGDVLRRAVSG